MKTTGRPGIIPKLRCRWKLSLRIVRIKTSPIHGWTVSRERSTRHWRRRLRRRVDRLMILLSNHIHQPPHRNTNNECLVLSYSCPSLQDPRSKILWNLVCTFSAQSNGSEIQMVIVGHHCCPPRSRPIDWLMMQMWSVKAVIHDQVGGKIDKRPPHGTSVNLRNRLSSTLCIPRPAVCQISSQNPSTGASVNGRQARRAHSGWLIMSQYFRYNILHVELHGSHERALLFKSLDPKEDTVAVLDVAPLQLLLLGLGALRVIIICQNVNCRWLEIQMIFNLQRGEREGGIMDWDSIDLDNFVKKKPEAL